jgi:hypothetical protein
VLRFQMVSWMHFGLVANESLTYCTCMLLSMHHSQLINLKYISFRVTVS